MKERKLLKQRFLSWRTRTDLDDLQILTIPVVFHFIDNDAQPSLSELGELLTEMNQGFANEGAYATDYGIDAKIRFCLAKRTPDGGASDGVNLLTSRYQDVDAALEVPEFVRHVHWDQDHYVNVWVANSIREEIAYYSGKFWWQRFGLGGFATNQGVVVEAGALNAGTLIHELGHYFGLLHPFEGFRSAPCKNDDCLLDGDMVCDTPPDRSIIRSCGVNSCDTDTLSNFSNLTFFKDTLDMGTNFMDYSECSIEFSHDQIDRMRFTIETSYPNLPIEYNTLNQCERPCEIEAVGMKVDRDLVIEGLPVTFTATGANYGRYEWYVYLDGRSWVVAPDSTHLIETTSTFTYTFDTRGWYAVYLKAWNDNDPACYSSFTRNIMVTCGVDARFSPEIREIASKQPDSLFTDSTTFVNYSVGADNYQWTVNFTDRSGAAPFPEFTSIDVNLTYPFAEPGLYETQLIATDGTCTDLSRTYSHFIKDPTMDGSPKITQVSCVNEDSIRVAVTLFNYGFDTINAGTPLSFYNGNRRGTRNPHCWKDRIGRPHCMG